MVRKNIVKKGHSTLILNIILILMKLVEILLYKILIIKVKLQKCSWEFNKCISWNTFTESINYTKSRHIWNFYQNSFTFKYYTSK